MNHRFFDLLVNQFEKFENDDKMNNNQFTNQLSKKGYCEAKTYHGGLMFIYTK